MGGVLIQVNCQTAKLRNAWETVRLRKTPGSYVLHASTMRWNAVHLTTSQGGVRRAEAIGQQQGVQEQRQDGVLGGPRCRKESRQPTHAAWSSASAACIIHQLHVESPGFSQHVTILTGEIYYSTSWYTAAVCTLYWTKCPSTSIPLYFENSKFELISHAWCHSIRQLLRDSKYSCNTGPC